MHKKFVVYSTAGEKQEFHITGSDESLYSVKRRAWNYYEYLSNRHTNDDVKVEIGVETWNLLERNYG